MIKKGVMKWIIHHSIRQQHQCQLKFGEFSIAITPCLISGQEKWERLPSLEAFGVAHHITMITSGAKLEVRRPCVSQRLELLLYSFNLPCEQCSKSFCDPFASLMQLDSVVQSSH